MISHAHKAVALGAVLAFPLMGAGNALAQDAPAAADAPQVASQQAKQGVKYQLTPDGAEGHFALTVDHTGSVVFSAWKTSDTGHKVPYTTKFTSSPGSSQDIYLPADDFYNYQVYVIQNNVVTAASGEHHVHSEFRHQVANLKSNLAEQTDEGHYVLTGESQYSQVVFSAWASGDTRHEHPISYNLKTDAGHFKTDVYLPANEDYSYQVMSLDGDRVMEITQPKNLHVAQKHEVKALDYNLKYAGKNGTNNVFTLNAHTKGTVIIAAWKAGDVNYEHPISYSFESSGTINEKVEFPADGDYLYKVYTIDGSRVIESSQMQRLEAPTASGEWDPYGAYVKGDVVTWHGYTFKNIQKYQGYGDLSWITALDIWQPVFS